MTTRRVRTGRGRLPRAKLVYVKLALAVTLDLLDATIGRVLGFGPLADFALTGVAWLVFGWKGLVQLWELADPSGRVDGFVPTLTLLALAELPPREGSSRGRRRGVRA